MTALPVDEDEELLHLLAMVGSDDRYSPLSESPTVASGASKAGTLEDEEVGDASTTYGPYRFPDGSPFTGDEDLLITRMADAVAFMNEQRLNRDNFLRARASYCSMAVELNQRGSIAPAYRPRMAPPERFNRHWTDNIHASDLQVLDVHWLHCRNPDRGNVTKTTAPMFTGGDFDFDLAGLFACLPWKMDKKVSALRLVAEEAWEMALIYPSNDRETRKRLEQDRRRIDDAVKRGQRRNPSLRSCGEWGRIWTARRIVELIDGPSGVTPSMVADVYARMTGIAKERRTIGTQLQRIERFLHDHGMSSMASASAHTAAAA